VETTGDHADTIFLRGILHIVSPATKGGRLVYDGDVTRRVRNYYNTNTTLGGSKRLRGYPTNYITEPNVVAQSVEWRTKPLDILRTQWGLVGFWDAAAGYEKASDLQVHHSVGLGIRALFPQFDRLVTRFDFGVPVYRGTRPSDVSPFAFLLSVEQAFPVPNVIDPVHTID
jgi:outer membrane protein assembly factor BamA